MPETETPTEPAIATATKAGTEKQPETGRADVGRVGILCFCSRMRAADPGDHNQRAGQAA
jgi:hypothetical protein